MPAVLADAGVELLLIAAFLVLYGMLVVHKYTLSPVLLTIAHVMQKVSIPLPFHHVHPLRFAAKVLEDIDRSILHWLSVGVSATEGGIVRVFHATANALAWTGKVIGDLAWDVYSHAVHLEHVVLPRLIRDAEKLARRLTSFALHELARVEHYVLHLLEARVLALWHELGKLEHRLLHAIDVALAKAEHYTLGEVAKAYHYADHLEARLWRGIDALRVDLTKVIYRGLDDLRKWVEARLEPIRRELADLEAAIPKVEGGLNSLSKEVQGLEGLFAAGAFAAAVAVALDALGFSWLKCKQVGRLGKALCGLESKWLDFLLGGLIDVLVVENLCEIVHVESVIFGELEPVLYGFVDTADALVGCNGATAPRPVALLYTALPTPSSPLVIT